MLVKKFFSLTNSEKIIALEAVTLLFLVRFALACFSLPRVLGFLQSLVSLVTLPKLPRRHILSLLKRSSRYVPFKTTCLSLALVAQALLIQSGGGGVLKIGVKKVSPNWMEAHAWLEEEGEIVLGGSTRMISDYTPILEWDGA